MGFYSTLYLFSKLFSSKKKAVEAGSHHHHHSGASDAIPSVDSPAFSEWIAAPGNVEKLLSSLEK
jgi:hypothetical protein